MFDLLRSAGDDQFALMGCAAVLMASGLLMYISYFVGPVARQERARHMDSLIRERQKLLQQMQESSREKAA